MAGQSGSHIVKGSFCDLGVPLLLQTGLTADHRFYLKLFFFSFMNRFFQTLFIELQKNHFVFISLAGPFHCPSAVIFGFPITQLSKPCSIPGVN